MNGLPPPLELAPLAAPDRDFETMRAEAIARIVAYAGARWTDHNESDPGITILELLVWGLADLHYRTENRPLDLTPIEVPRWLDRDDRHWSGLPLLEDPEALLHLAEIMATPAGIGEIEADRMRRIVSAADSRQSAIGAVVDETFAGERLTWDEATTVVRLVRAGPMRRAAQDLTDRVAAALEKSEDDDDALRLLRYDPAFDPLWDDEIRSLFRRQRHRVLVERVRNLLPEITALSGGLPETTAFLGTLATEHGLTVDEGIAALAFHPCPPGVLPEAWEETDGTTATWPPHPLQSRTCEPATAEDYARRARTVAGVRRAWVVPSVLPGVGWDGVNRTDAAERPGATTLLVEPDAPVAPGARRNFLLAVLRGAVGAPTEDAEVDLPYDTYRDDLQDRSPRRMICDELGAAIVRSCGVTLKGTLHVAIGTDRDEVVETALQRVAAFFAAGRPESRPPPPQAHVCPRDIEGPWPPTPQPPDGWNPGEDIRVAELVQVLSDDARVIGVEGVQARLDGGAWHPATGADEPTVPLPADCVPEVAATQCLQVHLELAAECDRG